MTRFERCRRRRPQRRVVDTKNHRQKIKLNFILITTTNCLCVVKRKAWHSSGKKWHENFIKNHLFSLWIHKRTWKQLPFTFFIYLFLYKLCFRVFSSHIDTVNGNFSVNPSFFRDRQALILHSVRGWRQKITSLKKLLEKKYFERKFLSNVSKF